MSWLEATEIQMYAIYANWRQKIRWMPRGTFNGVWNEDHIFKAKSYSPYSKPKTILGWWHHMHLFNRNKPSDNSNSGLRSSLFYVIGTKFYTHSRFRNYNYQISLDQRLFQSRGYFSIGRAKCPVLFQECNHCVIRLYWI